MYCPNCGTNNLEGARFCRSCGADVSLVPQAMTGHLPQGQQQVEPTDEGHYRRRRRGEPSLEKAVRSMFTGLGFLAVTLVLAFVPMGRAWWFWMFIPAFATLGGGVAEYIRFKMARERALPGGQMSPALGGVARPPAMAAAAAAPPRAELPRRNTAELVMPPPSVTEGTTRHLGAEAPTRHIGRAVDNPQGRSREDS